MPESKRPLKRFSQNFLTNPLIQNKIVDALRITAEDRVIEIGPGKGALTDHVLRANPASFQAIEIDRRWIEHLKNSFGAALQIIERDVLEVDFPALLNNATQPVKVLGNLPYHITSPILFKLIDNYRLFHSAVLMTQKEVARRITAQPRTKEYGILAVLSQTYARAEYLFDVKPGNFFPAPSVDSAVFRLTFYPQISGLQNENLFRALVRGTFNTRRKMLRNSLGRIYDKSIVYSLESVSLDRRPEELTIQEFKELSNELDRRLGQTHA
jgi:16S rRNA (adenine1518-N6/adenine1519-N6)-dimethyltransferase